MRISDWSSDVCSSDLEGLVPAGLWRGDDPPIAGRGGIEIERAEARDAKRLMFPLAETRANCGQRLVGRGGGQFHHRPDVVRPGSRDAHAFGAAKLYACQKRHCSLAPESAFLSGSPQSMIQCAFPEIGRAHV